MIDRRKKYLIATTNNYPHCGQLIQNYMTTHKISQSFLAARLGVLPCTVHAYFRNESLQVGILWKISQALDYNFLAALSEKIPIAYDSITTIALKTELDDQKTTIKNLEMKIDFYKEMNPL